MPLVIIAGRPCTGKTTFAQILRDFLVSKGCAKVVLVNEESLKINKYDGYSTSNKEKDTRGGLKSAVEHNLTPDSYVILDSLNYIKGYRYELYCTARTMRTPHCVIWVACHEEYSNTWNTVRIEQNQVDGYDPLIMADIRKRFEIPNDNNRWDNPLFKVNMNPVTEVVEGKVEVASTDVEVTPATTTSTSSTAAAAATGVSKMKTSWKPKSKAKDSVAVETTAVPETVFHKTTITTETETSQQATPSSSSSSNTPATAAALSFSGSMVAAVDDITSFQSAQAVLEDVFHHLSSSVTIIPNCSTVTPLHASADLLYELDRTSQKILQLIIQHQIDQVEGTPIQLLEYERALTLHRHISLSELQRFRRQYVKMNAQHPPSSSKLIGASFVDFLASQI